ncbi:urea ABC transporter permease subunit UrtB [Aestuariivirga litoralis]|uniref:Urea ABC transporter permease subunit UrtB n=1 Tax=Aestuariivirga litoralis TaxID=2650924 RepID=A0A2W2AZE8_9HYPH|nr:urea ABC transporter permease subunit UrtB [Aestuariivirga litoralis]PZF78020.1 urea ABC transporter permease subunit UrtB [Aestuariivirga litoralis]
MRRLIAAVLLLLLAGGPALADLRQAVNALGQAKLADMEQAIKTVAAEPGEASQKALDALGDGSLYVRKADRQVFIAVPAGDGLALTDPVTGEAAGVAPKSDLSKIKINNALRRLLKAAAGGSELASADPAKRLSAAQAVLKSRDAAALPALEEALGKETDATVKSALELARAAAILSSDRPDDAKLAAISTLAATGSRDVLPILATAGQGEGVVADSARRAASGIEATLAYWNVAQNVWYGISLGSVLLLAAIGLAITFGVMGVINMAHGEMVMLGAYTTFVVQELIRARAPGLFDASLLIALPLAFLVAALMGMLIERTVIRPLYGRPLETLLATWGVSLILQQGVRMIFGPTNREVGNPSWASGAFELGQLSITYNRLWLVLFSLAVFFALYLLLNKTVFGLHVRAVTQNRRMASAIGIRTPWIGALTFAVGSGIAGIAGVGLSQIDNVSPDLGQGYSIDSFMVVVFGGVGSLWGTLVASMTLGIVNKLLEPFAGAVLGKILVLVFIILFIQKRPRGLFALKGRFVET